MTTALIPNPGRGSIVNHHAVRDEVVALLESAGWDVLTEERAPRLHPAKPIPDLSNVLPLNWGGFVVADIVGRSSADAPWVVIEVKVNLVGRGPFTAAAHQVRTQKRGFLARGWRVAESWVVAAVADLHRGQALLRHPDVRLFTVEELRRELCVEAA